MRILILGNGRSGSSMLGMMLGSHPMMTNVGEAYNIDDSFITPAKKKLIKEQGLCGVCGKNCSFWHPGRKVWGEKGIWVDTSKLIKWDRMFGPNACRYIRITRSIYDRLGSFKKTKGKITKEIVENWVKYEKQISDYLADKSHFKIKYEDLCAKTGLQDICRWLGLPFQNSMWEFWKTLHHPIRGNAKTNLLVKLHHGLIKKEDLNHKEQEFMDNIGFNVTYYDRTQFLTDSDRGLIRKHGGEEMNRRLNY